MAIEIVLYGDPRTKKNHSRICKTKTGRYFLRPSSEYERYERSCIRQLADWQRAVIDYRINAACVYYMQTHRTVDLPNLEAATDDILVKAGVLKDDNVKVVATHDGSYVDYDKENPRVEITITEVGG